MASLNIITNAKLIFEISSEYQKCIYAEGHLGPFADCASARDLNQSVNVKDIFHPCDMDIANEIFSSNAEFINESFIFRAVCPYEDKTFLVKAIINKKLESSTNLYILEMNLSFPHSEPLIDFNKRKSDVNAVIDAHHNNSEQEYLNIYNNAPIGLFKSTHNGKLLSCNTAFATLLGYSNPVDAIKDLTNIREQIYVHHEDRDELITNVGNHESWVALDEVEWIRKDKKRIYVGIFGRQVLDPATQATYIEGAALDISSRVNAEKKLTRSNHLYAALSRCNEAIIHCKTEHELFDRICKDSVEYGELKMAWIAQLDTDNQTIVSASAYGLGKEYINNIDIKLHDESPESSGPIGSAFRHGHAIWCQDYQNAPITKPWHEKGKQFGWKSLASIPLFRRGKVVSTLNLYADTLNFFDVSEQSLLLTMADNISYALNHFDEVRLLTKYDRDLRESQALNRVANRVAKIGGWAIELPEKKLFWSDEIYGIHGIRPEVEISIEEALSFFTPKYYELVKSNLEKCLTFGSSYELDVQIINKGGKLVWTRISGQGVWDKNKKLVAIHGAMQDITSIKANEASLKLLSQAVEQSPSSVVITDLDGRIEYVNETFLMLCGYDAEEVLGRTHSFLQSGKTLPNEYRKMWSTLKNGRAWHGEFYNKRKDGTEYIVSLMISPVRNNEGEIINYLSIGHDITEKKQVEERVTYLAHYDQLTELPNRVLLNEHFQFALNMAKRNGEQLAVMFLDLDNFKAINDGLGHSVGDQLLIQLSDRLKKELRTNDFVGRFGGDEFIVVLPNTDTNGAGVLAEKLRKCIAEPFKVGSYELTCSSSIGITMFPEDGNEVEILLKNADAAMYKVKQFSKNSFMFFTPEMQLKSKRNLELSLALRTAIQEEHLYLMYQPQIQLSDMKMIGIEALLRWKHPILGEISPDEFIPIAEESGLINEIGRWVLGKAISDMQTLMTKTDKEFQVAINISVVQFLNRSLRSEIDNLLAHYQVPANRITLEITEAVAMSEPEIVVAIMDELNKLGVGIAIDDFGTGYSSLSYLKKFRVDKLKIDKSFIDDIDTDIDDRTIVSTIISMAQSLGLKTIAEGVETQAQVDWLKENQCDQIQGYFFSKPIIFRQLLQEWQL